MTKLVDLLGQTEMEISKPPREREHFTLPLHFTDAEGDLLMRGYRPIDMDDRWLILYENGWLHFHRSWTGDCIFGVKLDGSPAGIRVVDAWASRDRSRYNTIGLEQEKQLISELIDTCLLDKR